LVFAVCILVLAIPSANGDINQGTCNFVYGQWTACADGQMNRTVVCTCDGVASPDLTECLKQHNSINPIVADCDDDDDGDDDDDDDDDGDDDEEDEQVCGWRWTKWTMCTAECGGGNTTRQQVCVCEGDNVIVGDEWCDPSTRFGNESDPCNAYACGAVPAYNKMYWIYEDEEGKWPMADGIFNCSMGVDPNDTAADSPKGKSYSSVLLDPSPQDHNHAEWYFIAKEWIAAILNIANGVKFSPDALQAISEIGQLLEYCDGWPTKDIYEVYAGREKLGRINNNIGGLSNVDQEMAFLQSLANSNSGSGSSSEGIGSSLTITMVIAIPSIAIMIVGIIIGVTVYIVRERNYAVVEKAAFESEDEASEGEPLQATVPVHPVQEPQGVPLESDKPTHSGEDTSEEKE